eukprot:scaffold7052_cov254-Pinguiococcus_pyrenoidosus.AAC.62
MGYNTTPLRTPRPPSPRDGPGRRRLPTESPRPPRPRTASGFSRALRRWPRWPATSLAPFRIPRRLGGALHHPHPSFRSLRHRPVSRRLPR